MTTLTLPRFIWHFIRPYRFSFLSIALISLVWCDGAVWPYLVRLVVDTLTQFDQARFLALAQLKWPLIAAISLWITVDAGFRIQGFMLARVIPEMEASMRMYLFDHVQHHSPAYFNVHLAGSLANKITDMTSQTTLILQQLLTLFFPTIISCLVALFFFWNIHPLFAVLLMLWVVVQFSIAIFFGKRCDYYEHRHGELRSRLLGKIVDSLTNNFAVNLFYRFGYEKKVLAVEQQYEKEANRFAKRYVERMRIAMSLSTFLCIALGINIVMIYFWIKGRLTTGEVIQLFNTTWNLVMILWIAGTSIPLFFQSVGLAKQALTLVKDPKDIEDLPDSKPLVVSRGEIRFENVAFRYGNRSIFKNKNVKIGAGEKVGLVGYSGAGKSTFVSLILRLYHPYEGAIFIDDQSIKEVTLESLRKQVALIAQDPILFHRSIFDNIHYGNLEATKEEVYNAAHLAHCDEFIQRLPQQYDSLVGERGAMLSGGERQRIAIARAIIADAPLLILDEATSSLDSITEKYIQESLERLMQNRTTLVIAHRLSTLNKMDRILVFDQGRIIEEGSHAELLALGGHYTTLWHRQAGGFLPTAAKNGV